MFLNKMIDERKIYCYNNLEKSKIFYIFQITNLLYIFIEHLGRYCIVFFNFCERSKMKRVVCLLICTMILTGCASAAQITSDETTSDEVQELENAQGDTENKVKVLDKEKLGNPISRCNDEITYGGDPNVLVDGDTVYLYTGHDASTDEEVKKSIYNIPEYLCYSSKDMNEWTYEGVVMTMDNVSWASNDTSAWAAQVAKHFDADKNQDMYYLYYCTWEKSGKQGIGVAVSDSPKGPFEDIGAPLVKSTVTKPATSSFNDIDPTVWIETDETGEEHRYLAWGNGIFYICELNEDMISVKDLNGDGEITCGHSIDEADIISKTNGLDSYTEAPWLYRRMDENGNYYGEYYLFFAHQWRECMAYATTDDLMSGKWSDTKMIMLPTTTSNTNHMAVCDFKGKSYFIYHNGSLPKGNGYRRSACVRVLEFNEDGSISMMEETSAGTSAKTSEIKTAGGEFIGHEQFNNSTSDSDYPYTEIKVGANISTADLDNKWVIRPGKADEDKEEYVSIESENKSGLYITARKDGSIALMPDTVGDEGMYKKQTFKTVEGLADGTGVSFESVFYEGEYLTLVDGVLTRTDGSDKENSTFYVEQ